MPVTTTGAAASSTCQLSLGACACVVGAERVTCVQSKPETPARSCETRAVFCGIVPCYYLARASNVRAFARRSSSSSCTKPAATDRVPFRALVSIIIYALDRWLIACFLSFDKEKAFIIVPTSKQARTYVNWASSCCYLSKVAWHKSKHQSRQSLFGSWLGYKRR